MATRTCRTCGGKIAAGAAFCTSCGAPAPATADPGPALQRNSATPPTQANTGCWKWGFGILFGVASLIIAVLFGGAWYMGAFNPIDFNKFRASPEASGAEPTNTVGNNSTGPSISFDGRWDVTFTAGNVRYSGEMLVSNGAGTLTVTYVGPHGPMRVREECELPVPSV